MIRAVISTLFISSLIAQGVEISEFPAKLKEQDYSIVNLEKSSNRDTLRYFDSKKRKEIFKFY